ncbi:NurA domain-containing protein [Rivularia sp. PCC 7116]|uniref:DNA double-strand break repair nuclease NurA n=1 Tax=Rivularia sp. PCC 7116 TaxID=373994 RepID=UPI00029EF582|nr:DNA double-strand break repair nuclease NurA [Rivularia sp. PCC 7116]AFY57978.1 NurA domain-containing protein [Rivularia sp. PCC 7116]
MLDLSKLAGQMRGLSQHLTQEAEANRQRLQLGMKHLEYAFDNQDELVKIQQKWRDRILFANATPMEPLHTCIDIMVPPKIHTVIATDGSQIAPNHHEIAYCYLLNIGRVVLHYGQNKHPILDSLPEIFYRPEDLYMSRQWGIRTEEWMSYRRTASEAVVLSELAIAATGKGDGESSRVRRFPPLSELPNPKGRKGWEDKNKQGDKVKENSTPSTHSSPSTATLEKIPTLAMVDGSLIYWFLEQLPYDAREYILPPILESWKDLREAGIPMMGYLSASRSIEAMNFFRLSACPHKAPDCMSFCPNQMEKIPCKLFEGLRDSTLWSTQLKPGQRSPLWKSNSRILDLYDSQQIYFCYVHVGTEIARVEFPQWVVEDTEMFEESLGLMLAQVHKGYGYPVALAESHNQAVVRGGDRSRFFSLLERQMIKAGLKNVGTSYKEARKRGSIA